MTGGGQSPEGNLSYTDFILLGFPGLQQFHALLFIPFFCLYLVNVGANCTVIYTIWVERSLHSPMYLLISLLSAMGLCSTSAILPQMLLGFLAHSSRLSILSMVMGSVIIVFDTFCILASYTSIIHTALQIASGSLRRKAFHTCGTQLLVMFFMYSSFLSSSIVYRAGQAVSQDVHNLLSAIYLLLPSTLNPIIYGVRTKEIKQRVLRAFGRRQVPTAEPDAALPEQGDKSPPC
uniref:Olfactory receptor 52K1-like n=1 Tax=Pelodiscus sinensis TaxID=13735 RepID=K7FQ72_PELSI